MFFNLTNVDRSWHLLLEEAMQQISPTYLTTLSKNKDWLPGPAKIFSAFSLPLSQTKYILFGESPYPRASSANGYAFWDAAVTHLWSETGLTKPVNRATSLRHIIKMLLIAEGLLYPHKTTQADIAHIDKTNLVQTNTELFQHFLAKGFLLLNATPVLREGEVKYDAKIWLPFLTHLLSHVLTKQPTIQLILLGKIAQIIEPIISSFHVNTLIAEHPYNLSFIHNQKVIEFFRPLHLLIAKAK